LYYVLKVKKMKKLVLMAAAIVAVSFASCGNKAANAEQATADSIRIADSIAAVEAAAAEAAAAAAGGGTGLLFGKPPAASRSS